MTKLRPRLATGSLAGLLLKSASRFGLPYQKWAAADWNRSLYRRDQREFLESGFQTIIPHEAKLKSLDNMICQKINEIFHERPDILTYVVATGDADFFEVIRNLQDHGKYVILWATRNSIGNVYQRTLANVLD